MAACEENRPSTTILADRLYFAQIYPLVNYFQISYLQVPAVLIFFRNLRKFENAVKVRVFSYILAIICCENQAGLKMKSIGTKLIQNKKNYSYQILLQ